MANIDKTKLIQTYGIDDDNFIAYLNKFATLKKIVDMERLDIIPKDKLTHLYNRFIYYNSLGHNLNTIVEETTPKIRELFFFNGDGYFEYNLPVSDTTKMSNNYSKVTISGRICQVKIQFKTVDTIPSDTLLFELLPAPFSNFNTVITYRNNDIPLYVCDDGIKLVTNSIQANIDVRDTITYIIKK